MRILDADGAAWGKVDMLRGRDVDQIQGGPYFGWRCREDPGNGE